MGTFLQTTSLFEKGQSLLATGDYVHAIPVFLDAVTQDPNHFQTRFLLGICYLRTNDLAAAEQSFRKAVALDNGSHDGHYYLGLALERQGRKGDAQIEYRFALAIKPDFREAAERIAGVPRPAQKGGAGPAKPDAPAKPAAAGSLAEQIAARKGPTAEGLPVPIAGKEEIARYRRMRSFSGHFLLTFIALVVWILAAYVLNLSRRDDQQIFVLLTVAVFFLAITLFWRSRAHHYTIFERRIDIKSGLLFRRSEYVWLYQIEDSWITRSPLNLLTGDSKLHIQTVAAPGTRPTVHKLSGLGNHRRMDELWVRLRDKAVVERREMKSIWI